MEGNSLTNQSNNINSTESTEIDLQPEKVRKPRKIAPRFTAELLLDETRGLEALYQKVEKLDPDIMTGTKENLQTLMEIYQKWLFQLFPADFNDMCWKIADYQGVRNIVRSFVLNLQDSSLIIQEPNQENAEPPGDNTQGNENESQEPNENGIENHQEEEESQPLILDLLGEEH